MMLETIFILSLLLYYVAFDWLEQHVGLCNGQYRAWPCQETKQVVIAILLNTVADAECYVSQSFLLKKSKPCKILKLVSS